MHPVRQASHTFLIFVLSPVVFFCDGLRLFYKQATLMRGDIYTCLGVLRINLECCSRFVLIYHSGSDRFSSKICDLISVVVVG